MHRGVLAMPLTAPRQLYFIIAVVIALLAVLSYFITFIPIPAFWQMTVAFVILALACLMKGV
jgi:hypothetical protein